MKKLFLIALVLFFAFSAFGQNALPPRYEGHYSLTYDANCKLLIHSHTTDGSTTFLDACPTGRTVSIGAADVEHDTDQKKLGDSSILFDGDSGYLSIADHADWDFGAEAFTIDFWVRWNSVPDTTGQDLFGRWTDSENYMRLYAKENSGNTDFSFRWEVSDVIEFNYTFSTPTVSANKWYHFALIRGWGGNANDYALCLNGIPIDTTTDSSVLSDMAGAFVIGKVLVTDYFDGWMEEFHAVKGTAMWTRPFRPPTRFYLSQ